MDMSNVVERRKEMHLFKNYRNYIPLIFIIICFVFYYFYLNIEQYIWNVWLEIFVIALPFVLVPISNVVSMVLNTHKLRDGKKLYLSILFSYVLQLLPVLTFMIGMDDKGMWIMQSYSAFLFLIDAITFVYPLMIYPNRKQ